MASERCVTHFIHFLRDRGLTVDIKREISAHEENLDHIALL
jgi:hypothetical protein